MNLGIGIILLVMSGSLNSGGKSPDARIRLGSHGEILAWLIAGPFPNFGALQLKGTGFRTDYLKGESEAEAAEGQVIAMIPSEAATDPTQTNKRRPDWRLGIGNSSAGIDLDRLLNGTKPAIGYCYTELVSPADLDAKILFGSDDGAKVFFNGQQLFSKQIARGIKRDEDTVAIHLKAGRNRLLFKIEQGDGAWGLLARVADLGGRPIPGLTESIRLDSARKSKSDSEGWLRASAGTSGTYDLESAVQYEAVAKKASLWISRFRPEAADPEELESALEKARKSLSELALTADEVSKRFEFYHLRIENAFNTSRSPLLKSAQLARPLVSTDVRIEDFIQVMPKGRFFQHVDGVPFTPIGYNHNPDWEPFVLANPSREDYEPEVSDRYMAHLHDSGVNVIRLMIETPPSGNLEDPIGHFSPEHVRWIDNIFLSARKHQIKLIITPWDTFWMNLRWETTPYNPALGGLVKNRIDFIREPEVRKQEKARLKYMIDRWGNTGDVFAWELLNEADNWWGASAAQLDDWTHDMAQFVRQYEHKKWGRNHLVNVSFMESMPKGDLGRLAYDSPDLDYASTHLYIGASRAPKDRFGPALTEVEGVAYSLGKLCDTRPYIDTENGPIDRWIDDPTLDEDVFLGMIWAHMASGAAGSGFRWPYRHPHHLTEGMLQHLKQMSAFAEAVPWHELSGSYVPISISSADGSANACFGTEHAAILWSTAKGQYSLQWSKGPAKVHCRLFDTRKGVWTGDSIVERVNGHYVINQPIADSAILLTTLESKPQ